ncbi:MAG: lipopolysaccharide heptosyltransferase II [Candidatus Omnitrophota bacterium]
MNILQILPELNVGGVETGTLDLAKHLVRLGHKSIVVSAGGELVKELESGGSIHYQLPVHKKSFITMLKSLPRLIEIIRKEKVDIVHARSRVPAWIAYFACRRTGAIFITTCHGYYKKHPFSFVMGWAKRVIVLSNVIGRHMKDNFGTPIERIRLIPRSVDLEKFKFTNPAEKRRKEFNVGIIGRLTPIKGHLHFIKAMAKVARSVAALKIWIVGDAPPSREAYKEQVEVLVKRLGLMACTEFLGTQRDIPAVMAHLDVLVLATTTHEAFGRVIVEAQASGVPVVATSVGGVIDIIEDGINGLLVPPADSNAIAEAVLRLFKDKEFAAGLSSAAYEKVKNKYGVELMVKATLDVYEEALKDYKILVLKFSSLGDIILSSAALRSIREKFGAQPLHARAGYKISALTSDESKELLLRCPYIDELLVCDFLNRDKGVLGLWNLGRVLRKNNFDIVIDLQNSRKSHILAFLTLSAQRYGYRNRKFSLLLNRTVKDGAGSIGPVAHQFRILEMLGIKLQNPGLEVWPSVQDEEYIEEFLKTQWLSPQQKIIGINIAASERWLSKNWPLKHMVRLCEELNRRDLRVVITGTDKDVELARSLQAFLKDIKVINACAKTTVNQLACLIKKCAVYVSPDSASLHIAAAVGVPFVALFGPTDYRRHMPAVKNFALVSKGLTCGPCYKPQCKTLNCMELITPAEVLEAIDKLLVK